VVQTDAHTALISDHSIIGMEYKQPQFRLQAVFSAMALMQVVTFLYPPPSRALCLGLGAGTAPHFMRASGIHTDVVELDPAVINLAEQHFLFGSDQKSKQVGGGSVVQGDAIKFVHDGPAINAPKYDVILSDLWSGGIDGWALRLDFFEQLKSSWLEPNGTLAINVVAFSAGKHATLASRVVRTMGSVFAHVQCFAEYDTNDPANAPQAAADPHNLLIVGSDALLSFDYAQFQERDHYHYPNDGMPPEPGSMFDVHAHFESWQPAQLRDAVDGRDGSTPLTSQDDWASLNAERAAVAAGMEGQQTAIMPREVWELIAREAKGHGPKDKGEL